MAEFKTQKELFDYIWETRAADNGYKSELTDNQLYHKNHPKWHWQFLHILPKGSYPKYKFRSENIILGTPMEHENQNDYEIFNERFEQLRRQYYKEFYGKEF